MKEIMLEKIAETTIVETKEITTAEITILEIIILAEITILEIILETKDKLKGRRLLMSSLFILSILIASYPFLSHHLY